MDNYHHGNLRESILSVSMQLLEQRGEAEVSIRSAARAAGVSHNAPYRHFPTKGALMAAIAARGYRELGIKVRAYSASAREAGAPDVYGATEAYVDFALKRPAVVALMLRQRRDEDPDLVQARVDSIESLQEAVDAATLRRRQDAKHMARLLWATAIGVLEVVSGVGDKGTEARRNIALSMLAIPLAAHFTDPPPGRWPVSGETLP